GGVDASADHTVVDTGVPGRDCTADRGPDGLATHLDCAGLYSDFAAKTVAAENLPFTPGVEFWSDGAVKQRFVYLPPNSTIDISMLEKGRFPTGSRLFKEFKVEGKRIETRMFEKGDSGWVHATYRWNDAETDAVRKDDAELIQLAGRTPYEVPAK